MSDLDGSQHSHDKEIQNEIVNELKKSNELLESLLKIQSNVQARQRKFLSMAIAQIALIVIVLAWWGSKYGF
ncbi:MAG: hypothetical protein FHK82_03145 [Sedimenticola thiotaurini]|jgi:NH3-dependent NAD+ synthetase|uniref:Uncharacterized protein n=1 Tax=Sedimenticola thiotaurini TaxID=1543721 RepID=A0A558DG25_9GAMM|nr:MAG: hypothetical protein FHK82_03145 [Sedimenticola thiotaurini]